MNYNCEKDDVKGIAYCYDIINKMIWECTKDLIKKVPLMVEMANLRVKRRFDMIINCKCDLEEQREVDFRTMQEFADKNGMMCIETS